MFGIGKKSLKTRGKIQYDADIRSFFQFGNDMAQKLNAENDEHHFLDGRFVVSYSVDVYSGELEWEPADESLSIYFFPNSVSDEIASNHLHPDFLNSSKYSIRINDYYKKCKNYSIDEHVNEDYEAVVKYIYKDFVTQSRLAGEDFAAVNTTYPSRPKSQVRQEISDLLSQCASVQSEMGD